MTRTAVASRRPPSRGPALLLALGLAGGGCATTMPPTQTTEIYADQGRPRSGLQIDQVPEGQRVMLLKSPDDVERVCSPRESDEGLGFSEGFQISLPSSGNGGGFGEQIGDQAVALSHPTAIVLLARELLFRACELSLNLDADPEQTLAIHERFLDTLERIAPATQPPPEEDDDEKDAEDDGKAKG